MKKVRYIVVSGIIVTLLLAGTAVAKIWAAGDDKLIDLGQALKSAKMVDNPDDVIAKVNGKPITKKVYSSCEAFLKVSNEYSGKPAPTKVEIIKTVAKSMLVAEEADRLGIEVSEEEIDREIDQQRKEFESATPDNQQKLRDYFKAQGIDLDDYWFSKEKRNIVRYTLRSRKIIANDLSLAKTDAERHKVFEDASKRIDDLYSKAKVEYIE